MPNNNLILRSVVSPWITPTPDFTRNSVLSFSDVDNNFIYLKGELINSIETSGNTITLKKINGNDLSFNVGSGGGSDYWTSGSSGNYSIKTINDSGLDATGNYSVAEGFQTQALGSYTHAEGYGTIAGEYTPSTFGPVITSGITFTDIGGEILPYITGTYNIKAEAEDYEITMNCYNNLGETWPITLSGISGTEIFNADGFDITEIDGTDRIYFRLSGGWSGSTGYTEASFQQITSCGSDTKYAHSEGLNTSALGRGSHAEGSSTTASGDESHAEGSNTTASGSQSHAEGSNTTASGNYSHAEGSNTTASGTYSHTEGYDTNANGNNGSHAEGRETNATGLGSHAEGFQTLASGDYSHAEGENTESRGDYSHAEGSGSANRHLAEGRSSHVEGEINYAGGIAAHAEGRNNQATADYSHAEGNSTNATGEASHSEGTFTNATAQAAHAEGYGTDANGIASHAEGYETNATGDNGSHAEGRLTTASGQGSHAEGLQTLASGNYSHSEGRETTADGDYSHAGGNNSTASGEESFIHSTNSLVTGDRSVVLGGQNITGTTSDTVYVPNLNINNLGTGTSVNNLAIDSNGNVVVGSSGSTGTVGGSGTVNYVSRWTPNGTTLGNSIIQDNGSKVSIGSGFGFSSKVIVTSSALDNQLYGFEVNNHAVASVIPAIGISGVANGVSSSLYNVGGHFIASNNSNGNYSLQLQDGTEAAGRFLKSIDVNGKANWSTITASDVSGATSGPDSITFEIFNTSPASPDPYTIYDDGNIRLLFDEAATDDIEIVVLTNPSTGPVHVVWSEPTAGTSGSANVTTASGQVPLNTEVSSDDVVDFVIWAPQDSSYPYYEAKVTVSNASFTSSPAVARVSKWNSPS